MLSQFMGREQFESVHSELEFTVSISRLVHVLRTNLNSAYVGISYMLCYRTGWMLR